MDYKEFREFYFRGLSFSLLAHVHINMQLYLHTVSLESRLSLYKIIELVRHYVLHLQQNVCCAGHGQGISPVQNNLGYTSVLVS